MLREKEEKYYPKEENLGKICQYWQPEQEGGCSFHKIELEGRVSCRGTVDEVCLFIKDARRTETLTEGQMIDLRIRVPGREANALIPPGNDIHPDQVK